MTVGDRRREVDGRGTVTGLSDSGVPHRLSLY